MKKNLLLIIFSMLLIQVVSAQPTLTSSGVVPSVGETFSIVTSAHVSPGLAGANQTWNLSTMTTVSSSSYNVVAPSSTPSGASFPGSNICYASGSGTYLYLNSTSTNLTNLGSAGSGLILFLSNSEDLLRFPFTMGNTYTDNWASTFTSSGYTFYRTGVTTVTADGYGTLQTPSGTFTNVLRVHFVQNYQDSANVGGTPVVLTYNNDQYMWYKEGIHYNLASVYTFTSSASGTNTGSEYMSGNVGFELLEAGNSAVSIYPNPAASFVTLELPLNHDNSRFTLNWMNSAGEMVGQTEIYPEGRNGPLPLEVASFPPGLYFLNIQKDGLPYAAKKIVLQRP